ncbi:hypothetical protein [Haloarchaeobius iranensis]|uniref:Uncharacterized protein n=1 Tax=Haloarchaeobius iranensis TaxID=996166 RepID=A0A1G9W770_9EURY|nr:hypothetical protein [Haloarchaeobius iranensis]SDM80097.1 hypothetical protein SAMN05192554_107183 [Haloarchaeobius iranensis]
MLSAETYWFVVQLLSLANVLVLTVAFCLSLVAVRGFAGAPINGMLKPLPVAFGGFVLVNIPWVVFGVARLPGYTVAYAATFSVATLAAVVAAIRAMVLLTERRDL